MIKNVWVCINEHRNVVLSSLGAAKNPACRECKGMTQHVAQVYICDSCRKEVESGPWKPHAGWLQVSISTDIYHQHTDEAGNENAAEYRMLYKMEGLDGRRKLLQPYLLDFCQGQCAGNWLKGLATYLYGDVKSLYEWERA